MKKSGLKKLLNILPYLHLLLPMPSGFAMEELYTTLPTSGHSEHRLELGLQLQHIDYQESMPTVPGFKSNEAGLLPGLSLGYSWAPRNTRLFFDSQFILISSNINYDGSKTEVGNGSYTPFTSQSRFNLGEIRVTGGYSFVKTAHTDLGLYSGLNFRNWLRELDAIQKAPGAGANELYATLSAPIGLRWNQRLSDRIQIGLDGSVGLPIFSVFQIYFGGNESLSNALKTKLSWKIQAPIQYWLTPTQGISLNPFFETIAYEETNIGRRHTQFSGSSQIIEPASTTLQFGTQIKFLHRF